MWQLNYNHKICSDLDGMDSHSKWAWLYIYSEHVSNGMALLSLTHQVMPDHFLIGSYLGSGIPVRSCVPVTRPESLGCSTSTTTTITNEHRYFCDTTLTIYVIRAFGPYYERT